MSAFAEPQFWVLVSLFISSCFPSFLHCPHSLAGYPLLWQGQSERWRCRLLAIEGNAALAALSSFLTATLDADSKFAWQRVSTRL